MKSNLSPSPDPTKPAQEGEPREVQEWSLL
jgi:hypothetical protein